MPTSAWYQGEFAEVKSALARAASLFGAFATLGIGFSWGCGLLLGSTAKTLADSMASSAVVAAAAPICVDQFQHTADAANNLTALKKTFQHMGNRATYVEKAAGRPCPGARRSIPAYRKPAPPLSAA